MSGSGMWCGECGSELVRVGKAGTAQCCAGRGYWSELKPLPRDRWYPALERGGMFFYRSQKCPPDFNPANPRQ